MNDVSAFAVFFAAIALYTNISTNYTEKFYLGTTVLNRSSEKQKNTMGMFVNTIPLLVNIPYDISFNKLLDSIFSLLLSAFQYL